jgi:molybdopterin-guanine dinucleotide biosynthesis protein MobB
VTVVRRIARIAARPFRMASSGEDTLRNLPRGRKTRNAGNPARERQGLADERFNAAIVCWRGAEGAALKVAALVGDSGSGKTTLIRSLIGVFRAEGFRVGALKHTHHPLNTEDRGDTRSFREAGAEPVGLAGDREAVIFAGSTTRLVTFDEPTDLLQAFDADLVLVEGFRAFTTWPQILITADARPSVDEARAILDRIWRDV